VVVFDEAGHRYRRHFGPEPDGVRPSHHQHLSHPTGAEGSREPVDERLAIRRTGKQGLVAAHS
jgi:hypothetical protein